MKFIPVLLVLAAAAHGASSDPGKTAVDFLEKVRHGKVDLSPGADTALSAQTSDGKKREIAKLLERIGKDLGSDPLEIGAVKTDENYAAVLIRKVGGFDPSRLQVFPVALVKRGSEWSAAPVPASFENAGAGYAVALRKRLDLLENWMLRQQVEDLQNLREQSTDLMRARIQASLSYSELQAMDAPAVGRRFLTACEKKDLPAVLGLMGGLSKELPADWSARLKAADRSLSGSFPQNYPWHLMTSPDVLRVVVHHEEEADGGLFSVGCLNPAGDNGAGAPRIEALHFELSKTTDGMWRVDPPEILLQESAEAEDEPEDDPDAELLDAFPAKWQAAHPTTPRPSAEDLYHAISSALRGGKLPDLLALGDFGGVPNLSRKACLQAAQVWWDLNNPIVAGHAMPLAIRESGNSAVALFQFFSARDPDKLNLRKFHFSKSQSGWLWTPETPAQEDAALEAMIEPDLKNWTENWRKSLLADSVEINGFDGKISPNPEDARKVMELWLAALRSGDVKAALALTARLGGADGGSSLLRNLGYEMTGTRRDSPNPEISSVLQGRIWTGVGTKTEQSGKTSLPFYPIIQTDAGPRILIEIDLFASRNRDFLNKTAFERLQKSAGQAATDELRTLFRDFQKSVEARNAP